MIEGLKDRVVNKSGLNNKGLNRGEKRDTKLDSRLKHQGQTTK